jgi:iron complex transport system substrate-binding protein
VRQGPCIKKSRLIRYLHMGVSLQVLFIIHLLSSPTPSRAAVFHDSLGRKVVVGPSPKRIVCLAPSITEMIYYLGLGERLVGVTQFSSFPEEARDKPKVGTYTDINVEKAIALDPDLAIGTVDGNRREDVEMLEEAGIPVYVVNPRNVHQILETIEAIGEICGVPDRARSLVRSLRQRVARVIRAVRNRQRPLVFLIINVRPLMSVNRGTTHHHLIELAGGRNLAGDQPITYPRLNIEEVLRRRPDVIIISSMQRGGEFERARREWLQWPGLPAVQKGNVYLIDSDLIDRASPRIVSGLEEMARLIHPEIAWDETR